LKLVITGAGGLLGSALLTKAKGHEVFSFYNQHLPASGVPVRTDLQNRDQIARSLREVRPDAIVHAAALTDVDRCERDRNLADSINFEATRAIAKCASDLGAFLIYVSTDYVFDGKRGMYGEDDEPRPINFYGTTKLRGERAVKELLSEYLVARTSVIYGSTPSSGKVNFALWVLNALKEDKPVSVTVDQFVSPTLNTNLAGMIMECLERRLTGTIHLAGATRLSRFDFAAELCREWSLSPSLINPVEMSKMNWYAPRPRDSSLDVTKAASILKSVPTTISQSMRTLKEELDIGIRDKGVR
jgi:dTDP-4-dehydrorhamnose reductase